MSRRRSLLTGGTGFVGANLSRRLLERGDDVHILVRPHRDRWRVADIEADLNVHPLDLRDTNAVRVAVAGIAPDEVFHLAAYGAYPTQDSFDDAVQTNVTATANLAGACAAVGVQAMVYAGSSSEYGLKDHAPSESEDIEPNSHYAATKACGTLLLRHLARNAGFPVVALRLYSVYGPLEEPSRFIPSLLIHAFQGSMPPLARPNTVRDFVHVDDVCSAFILAAQGASTFRGAVYNVGTGQQVTLRMAVGLAREILRVRREPDWGSMPDRHWDTTIWVADPTAIRGDLGWKPQVEFEAGLRLVVAWFRDHPEMVDRYRRVIGL